MIISDGVCGGEPHWQSSLLALWSSSSRSNQHSFFFCPSAHTTLSRQLKMPSTDGYDPQKSRLAEDKLADFLRAPLTGDIQEVPGIGEAAMKNLAKEDGGSGDDAITNTYQLMGKFLLLKSNTDSGEMVQCQEHCDAFWHWLKSKGINSYRSGIVMAVAEKLNTMIPGVYNTDELNA